VKLRFDPNQDFQRDAVAAVVDLFDGHPRPDAPGFRLTAQGEVSAVANELALDHEDLLANLQRVQERNGIQPDPGLRLLETFPNFSVEMETGTGKTYVYLRTALDLFQRYGFRKFVIVVPSIAVREGVLKTLEVTREHFQHLYDKAPYAGYRYDSANLAQVRQFAHSSGVELMVTTVDSFNKAANIMLQEMDQLNGQVPVHLVQATRPILILDEPQNLESEKSRAALTTLAPLLALRYSATHRDPYNLVYRLTPYDAYRRGLVKRIRVASVVKTDDANRPFVRVDEIGMRGKTAVAKVAIHQLMKTGVVKEKVVTVKPGDRLADKAARADYDPYVVDEIDPLEGVVRFAPANLDIKPGDAVGADKEAIFRAQIHHTVKRHADVQRDLRPQGIKVLSLFFVDRVDNYAPTDSLIRRLFAQAFDDVKRDVPEWKTLSAAEVQAAYFASKRRRTGEVVLLESASGETQDDQSAYDLIMRDKESLLSFPSDDDDADTRARKQVSFIFSHTALREGWDSPNVFQICTLNHAVSPMRKRQEVGRGVRLAVNQAGDRVLDERVNVLTVIANESYEKYVATLQSEIADEYRAEIEVRYGKAVGDLSAEERLRIAEEYGPDILPPPPARADRPSARLQKARVESPEFRELWNRIRQKTWYHVTVDTEALLDEVIPELNRRTIEPPRVTIVEAMARVKEVGGFEAIATTAARTAEVLATAERPNLLAVMAELLSHTTPRVHLTRRTLLEVIKRIAKPEVLTANPYEFARVATAIIKEKVIRQLVAGIRYEKIRDERWEMQRITDEATRELCSRYTEPSPRGGLYDRMDCDSKVEQRFVQAMEARSDVRFYMKLPAWFEVTTPLGPYRPDWAVVMDNPEGGDPLLYLVAETKGGTDTAGLRSKETQKIECARAHFGSRARSTVGALDGVDYGVVSDASQLPGGLS